MKSVIKNLLAKHPEIKLINIFSDGARSQFKQKFTLSNLPLWESVLNIKLTWHFLQLPMERELWMDWEGLLLNYLFGAFADLARQRNPNIDIPYIMKSKAEESKPFLEEQFANVGSYSGCSQIRCFKYYGNNIIHMSETSNCTTFTVIKTFIDPKISTESESNPNQ